MTSIRLASLVSLMTVAGFGTAFAQQGTEAQREACTPDAFRFCMSAMPDAGRVEGCLRAAGPRLNPACAAVFEPQRNAEATRNPRDRRTPRSDQPREFRRDYQERDYRSPQPRDPFTLPQQDEDD